MTIRYMSEAASARYSPFFRLIFRWKGSVHKAVLPETIAFGVLFWIIYGFYHNVMSPSQKEFFELFCNYCQARFTLIPVSFVLGFFVNIVVDRWWEQFLAIPWPDTLAIHVSAYLDHPSPEAAVIRKTIMRYINLAWVMSMRNVSVETAELFSTSKDIVISGLLTNKELAIINVIDTDRNTLLVPIFWAYDLVHQARLNGQISGDLQENEILTRLTDFREHISRLHSYVWINPPLIYTQLATITVYAFCLLKLFSQQIAGGDINQTFSGLMFVQTLAYFEFIFYVGWLKVAESLTNPFGDDDEDFDIKPMIYRNIRVSSILVNDLCHNVPPLTRDYLWTSDQKFHFEENEDNEMFLGTVAELDVEPVEEVDISVGHESKSHSKVSLNIHI